MTINRGFPLHADPCSVLAALRETGLAILLTSSAPSEVRRNPTVPSRDIIPCLITIDITPLLGASHTESLVRRDVPLPFDLDFVVLGSRALAAVGVLDDLAPIVGPLVEVVPRLGDGLRDGRSREEGESGEK